MMHGGDIYSKKIKMDFSVNINPLPLPFFAKKAFCRSVRKLKNYPDMNCRRLKEKMSEITGIPSENLIFGNGASELISALIRALNPKKTLLLAPSFTGYLHALSAFPNPEYFYLKKEKNFCLTKEDFSELKNKIKGSAVDFLIITNPNNPDGRLFDRNLLDELVLFCRENRVFILIDETFKTLTESPEITFNPSFTNLIIVRAFTKTFALAGLRLGWAFASSSLIARIKIQLPEWNLSLPAQETGFAILSREKKISRYLKKSRNLIKKERLYLSEKLKNLGFTVYPSDAAFILFYSDRPEVRESLFENLYKKHKILIRDCSDYEGLEKGFFRIGIKNHRENKKFIKKIQAEVLNGN